MLRRFRTWLANVIRPADVQPDPAPVAVAELKKKIDSSDQNEIQQIAMSILADRSGITGDLLPVKRRSLAGRKTFTVDHVKTRTFAMMAGTSQQLIIDWKNGKYKPPVGLPSHKQNGEKMATMWNREECLVFAEVLKKTKMFKDGFINHQDLAEILGVNTNAAYQAAKKWHERNTERSSWTIDEESGHRIILRSHAIEIGLERAGLAV